jgi:hypothetical protein
MNHRLWWKFIGGLTLLGTAVTGVIAGVWILMNDLEDPDL